MRTLTIILLFTLSALPVFAQIPQPPSDWAAVQQIRPGRELAIHTDATYLRCRFVAATADSVTCDGIAYGGLFHTSPSMPQLLTKAEIRVIDPRRRRIGGWVRAIFATGAAIVGLASDHDAPDRLLVGAVAGGLGFLLGYVVGQVIDSFVDALPIDPIYQRP